MKTLSIKVTVVTLRLSVFMGMSVVMTVRMAMLVIVVPMNVRMVSSGMTMTERAHDFASRRLLSTFLELTQGNLPFRRSPNLGPYHRAFTASCSSWESRSSQATVRGYMRRRPKFPSSAWRTFPRDQVAGIAAIDMFVVLSAAFRLLYMGVIASTRFWP